jgi:gluconate 2-dehydrogenase subunit 3-like protein
VTTWEEPHHLPSRRPSRRHLPRQRRGTTPQMVGRYPDFDVLAPEVVAHWDEPTKAAVLKRLEPPRQFRFFRTEELAGLRAFCDVVTDQHSEPRVPVAEMLDVKYAEGKLDGFRYAGMPDDREAWHLSLQGLDFTARSRYGRPFAAIELEAQRAIVRDLQEGTLQGGPWDRLDMARTFSVLMRGVLSELYSHPWAWNEIGFGGPAYPRGFMRFGDLSTEEPFESNDHIGIDPVRDTEARDLP